MDDLPDLVSEDQAKQVAVYIGTRKNLTAQKMGKVLYQKHIYRRSSKIEMIVSSKNIQI